MDLNSSSAPINDFSTPLFNAMEGSSFLLTGATGLVGTGLLSTLDELSRRHNLKIDLTTTSTSPLSELEKFSSLKPKHKILDLMKDPEDLFQRKYNFIIHAGGPAQPSDFMQRNYETYYINSFVTNGLLNALEDGGHFIFLSSSELYSGCASESFLETQIGNSSPSHPRACYIEGKRAGEMFIHWARDKGISASSLRLSYTYGPGSKAGDRRVINEIIESAIKRKAIILKDGGGALRTNLYVRDASRMILCVLNNPKRGIYNIAGVGKNSIKDIAQIVAKETGSDLSIPENRPGFNVYAQDFVPVSIEAFCEDYGTPILTNLTEGLTETIEWQRRQLYQDVC